MLEAINIYVSLFFAICISQLERKKKTMTLLTYFTSLFALLFGFFVKKYVIEFEILIFGFFC